MQQSASWSRGQRWRQTLLFGLPLALLEIGIVVITIAHTNILSPQRAMLYGLAAYLLLPAVAGFQFCYKRRHKGWESGWAGFRVGLVSAGIVMLAITMWLVIALIIYDNTPPPSPPSRSNIYAPGLALIIIVFLLGLLAVLNGLGITFSALGGRLGGALATWRAPRPQPNESQT